MKIYQSIDTHVTENGIAIITLNRPGKRNALSILMRREIFSCLAKWKSDDQISSVVFTGEGDIFCSGFDLDEFRQPGLHDEIFESSSRYHRELWYFPKPVIAAVNGPAVGGGFNLATLCDIRICSEDAWFSHQEVKYGAPAMSTPLRWIVGDGIARDICFTGRRVGAREAYSIGLVSKIESENVLACAVDIARCISEAPAAALSFSKQAFTMNAGKGFEESFEIEHNQAFRQIILERMSRIQSG